MDELVKRLRDDEAWKNCDFDFIYGWMHEAADSIEELATNYDAATDIMKHQTEYIEELEAKLPRWIPVTERLPEDAMQKIVCHSRGVSFGRYIEDAWYSSIGKRHCVQSVTHWMPLPQPPREGK